MGWEYPKHICGHDGEAIKLGGKHVDRERKLAWIEGNKCPDCRAAEQKEELAKEGLPELDGSAKQLLWANDIRSSAMNTLARIDPLEIKVANPELQDAVAIQECWEFLYDFIRRQESAHWWIEHRNNFGWRDNGKYHFCLVFVTRNQKTLIDAGVVSLAEAVVFMKANPSKIIF